MRCATVHCTPEQVIDFERSSINGGNIGINLSEQGDKQRESRVSINNDPAEGGACNNNNNNRNDKLGKMMKDHQEFLANIQDRYGC